MQKIIKTKIVYISEEKHWDEIQIRYKTLAVKFIQLVTKGHSEKSLNDL